jgi:hypothetical protein
MLYYTGDCGGGDRFSEKVRGLIRLLESEAIARTWESNMKSTGGCNKRSKIEKRKRKDRCLSHPERNEERWKQSRQDTGGKEKNE